MISKRRIAVLLMVVMPWLAGAGDVASGQDFQPGPFGFVRLLNAVSAGGGKLDFLVDGQPVRPEGYQLGNVTGGIALRPRSYQILIRRDGVTAGRTQLTVVANETTTLVPFAEQVPATEHEAAHWAIRILRLKPHPPVESRTASFVSVARQPALTVAIRQANGKWESLEVKRLATARAPIRQARGYLPVRCNGQPLSAISVAATGNFVAVLYDDSNGTIRSATYQDYQYRSAD